MQHHEKRGKRQYSKPDHLPMIPELRNPEALLDLEVRKLRLRYDEFNAGQEKIWR